MVRVFLLQTVKQHAQTGQLPVQAHAGPPQAAKGPARLRPGLAREDALLDAVDFGADLVGHAVHGVGDLVDDLFQKRCDGFDAMAALEHAPRRVDGAQRLVTAADQQPLGHRKAQKSSFLGGGIDVPHEIGKHAVDAIVDGMELLIIVVREQEMARERRNIAIIHPLPGARIGQIEVQPQSPVMAEFDRCIDRQRLRASIAMQPECPYQSRNCGGRGRRTGQFCRFSQDDRKIAARHCNSLAAPWPLPAQTGATIRASNRAQPALRRFNLYVTV
jgi:hypothetical protein